MREDEAREELIEIYHLPHGVARSTRAEDLVRRIEAEGPETVLAEALLDLVEAYVFSDEGEKGFAALARTLRLFDERPELFDDGDRRNLFWEFKWVAGDLSEWPRITTTQAAGVLDDMQRRYALEGYGASGVLAARFRYAFHTGDPAADEIRTAWLAAPRDAMSQCEACEPGEQADYLYELGRYDELVRFAGRLHGACNVEPARGLSALAVAQLRAGDTASAEKTLRLVNRRMQIEHPLDHGSARGQQLEALLVGGEVAEALARLRGRDAALLEGGKTVLGHLRFLLPLLAGVSAALHRGIGAGSDPDPGSPDPAAEPTGLAPEVGSTLGTLHARLLDRCRELAAPFDERNGNDYYAGLIARALAARQVDVPLSAARDAVSLGSAAGARASGPAASAASPGVADAASDPTTDPILDDPQEDTVHDANPAPGPDATRVEPLSRLRIQAILDGEEFNHGLDRDGDIMASWDDNPFWFLTAGEQGEILMIRSKWRAWVSGELRVQALQAVNEWNTTRFFPRVGLTVDDDGDVQFSTDRIVDLEHGATDAQLRTEVVLAISTSMQFYDFLNDRFPGAVEAADAFRAQQQAE